MPIVAVILAAATIVWGIIYAHRGSLMMGCIATLILGYVFGHSYWHYRLGPLPITLDRLALIGLFGAMAIQWRLGRLESPRLSLCDWFLGGLLLLLTISLLLSGQPEVRAESGSPAWRLVMSFWVPALWYWIARQTQLSLRQWKGLLIGMALLGVYLALTAVAETTHAWSLVFPRFIADPTLGTHFGRARGPALNSASLGLYLTACLWSTWLLRSYVQRVWQLVILAILPLMVLGIFFTYTRSTWLGLAASGLVVLGLQLPKRWRIPAISISFFAGLLILTASWGSIADLKREGSAGDSHHSIQQRASFTYVSWQMFKDHPLLGVGFGRFYDRKLPYLSDRTQNFELESIRPLHHHNTLLSLLTETGMIGLACFVALLASWTRTAWSLAREASSPPWVRSCGVLMLALLANYLSSALFHDLTLLPPQHTLLLLFAGLTVGLKQHHGFAQQTASLQGRVEYPLRKWSFT